MILGVQAGMWDDFDKGFGYSIFLILFTMQMSPNMTKIVLHFLFL